MTPQSAPFTIIKFWTDYRKIKGRSAVTPVDMIEYAPLGQATRTSNVAQVSALMRVREIVDPDDIAARMAQGRADWIKPRYEAWKTNQAMPEYGTPLAAWPGVTPEQAEILRSAGLRTVEEIAGATDSVLKRIQLPNATTLHDNAKRFLLAKDADKVGNALAERDEKIGDLNDQLEEMRRIVLEMQEVQRNADRPRRGRPPKLRSDDVYADPATPSSSGSEPEVEQAA